MQGKWRLGLFLFICFARSAIGQNSDETSSQKNEARDEMRWRTVVFDFEILGKNKEQEDLGQMAGNWLKTGLQNAGRFNLIDPQEATKLIGHEIKTMLDLISKETRTKIGEVFNWQVAIQGRIMFYKSSVDVNATLLEIQTGDIIQILEVTEEGEDINIKKLVEQLADEIQSVFPPQGEVYRIDEPKEKQIVLDRGSSDGVRKGARCKIYLLREVGNIKEEINLAEVEVTEVEPTHSYAKIIRQVGGIPPEVRLLIEKGNKFRAIRPLGRLDITTAPPGASISLGKTRLTSLSTPATIDIQSGVYAVSLSKQGYETWEGSVTVEYYKTASLNITLLPVINQTDRFPIALRSLLVPGLGQYYNGDTEEGIAAELLIGSAIAVSLYYDARRKESSDAAKTLRAFGKIPEAQEKEKNSDGFKTNRDIARWVTGGLWAASVIHAYLRAKSPSINGKKSNVELRNRGSDFALVYRF